VVLTAADVAPTFTGVDTFPAPYVPNPFLGCGIDGVPGTAQPIAATGGAFLGSEIIGGESVLRFDPGAAQRAMNAINELVTGPCQGFASASLTGGDAGILLASTDGGIVVPEAAHGVALVYAIVRYGDYLVWITLISQTPDTALTESATTLAERAGVRLCAVVGC
jgi:hypothetical protein